MKRKRTASLISSSSQQQLFSSPKSTIVVEAADLYLPDECWELVFKFLIHDQDNKDLKSLSVVSQQFLSITNRLPLSFTLDQLSPPPLARLFQRFTNVISLNLIYCTDLNKLLCQISNFSLNLTSLVLSCTDKTTFPVNGLRAFSRNITTLTSLTCSCIRSTDLFLIADCFPNLQVLHLKHCYDISEEGIGHVLRRCCNIRHLELACCLEVKLLAMNFKVPKLEVLNLSYTKLMMKHSMGSPRVAVGFCICYWNLVIISLKRE
ncbi:F-box/LRR-repeat protein [Trifolium repens]|nr:F-box/LRR-repeat protein [Trifolium repens]